MTQGTLHLLPNILAENGHHTIPNYVRDLLTNIKHYYVEELKSARRLLKKLDSSIDINVLEFFIINEHEQQGLQEAKVLLSQGKQIAYLSEAGCASVADPGQVLVSLAHQLGAKVTPHIGPNSILLALMASGFNGQQFTFHGYLPNKQPLLSNAIKQLEQDTIRTHFTQLFIETPYRNNQLIADLLKNCNPNTYLCVACNLTATDEQVISKKISEWRKMTFDFHKKPAVFLLFAP